MRWSYLIGLVMALGLLLLGSGCRGPYYYDIQLLNGIYGRITDVRLDWGKDFEDMGNLKRRGESRHGPYMRKPPAQCTLRWLDEGASRSATADVPAVREGFDGTFFILVKEDQLIVVAAENTDKETYTKLRELMPDPSGY